MSRIEWFLVANATQARLLQRESGLPLKRIASFAHPQGRLRSSALGDDRAGREAADRSFGAAAYEPRSDAHRKEHLRFAQELAEHLEQGAEAQAYASLVVFAGNPFLGLLREALGEGTRRLLKTSLPVDLSHVGEAEIDQRMRDELAPHRSLS